jgi:hypothetical protein
MTRVIRTDSLLNTRPGVVYLWVCGAIVVVTLALVVAVMKGWL